jgi:hypothetical protein
MFTLTANPLNRALAVRPVCKATDRPAIRELFRKEFYGSILQDYPDEGLWEIYDNMPVTDTDIFGAYLVSFGDRLLFLLEIHPSFQMDLPAACLAREGSIGVYCFFTSTDDPMNLPAFRTCISSLFEDPSVHQVLTAISPVSRHDPGLDLLTKTGFQRLPGPLDRSLIFRCSMETFPLFGGNVEKLAAAAY